MLEFKKTNEYDFLGEMALNTRIIKQRNITKHCESCNRERTITYFQDNKRVEKDSKFVEIFEMCIACRKHEIKHIDEHEFILAIAKIVSNVAKGYDNINGEKHD